MAASPVLPKLVGTRVKRREDPRLIRGGGTYVDDIALVGMQHLAFKRSDVAHGRIRSIDTSAAKAMPGVEAVYHLYVIRVNPELREGLQKYLADRNIATGIHYPIALPNLTAYKQLGHQPSDFPEASKASVAIVSLPIYAELTEAEVAHVCDTVKEFFAQA